MGVPHLGERPGSPGRASWIRRQRHAPSASHLAGERAEHGAGGWAAGTWAPHHGASTKVPLPAAQSASGAGPSLALGHQTHSTGDASSEPMGGGGQRNQAFSGPGKGQLRRSCVAGKTQSGPHFGPVPPYSPPSASPILALCPNSALSGRPGTCPDHRPGPSLAPGCHQHISTLMLPHTKKHTHHPPCMPTPTPKDMGASTHLDACTHRLYIRARDTYPEAHPTKTHLPTHPRHTHHHPHPDPTQTDSHTLPWFEP